MRILGFDWDDVNTEKLLAHELTREDVELLFEEGQPVFVPHSTHSERWIALGFAPDERFVLVVFEYDKETRWARVVTAYEAENERWWKTYCQKTKGKKPR